MMPTCPPLLTVDPTRAPLVTWTSLTLLMYVFSWSSLGFSLHNTQSYFSRNQEVDEITVDIIAGLDVDVLQTSTPEPISPFPDTPQIPDTTISNLPVSPMRTSTVSAPPSPTSPPPPAPTISANNSTNGSMPMGPPALPIFFDPQFPSIIAEGIASECKILLSNTHQFTVLTLFLKGQINQKVPEIQRKYLALIQEAEDQLLGGLERDLRNEVLRLIHTKAVPFHESTDPRAAPHHRGLN